jgi:anti-sigma factor RsiW
MSRFACADLVELVTGYLEGGLDAGARASFEEHLDGCEACAAYVEQMRETIKLTGRLSPALPPPAVCEELIAHFRTWRPAAL